MSVWKIIGIVALALVLIVVVRVALFPLFVANTALDTAEDIVEQTLDADNVIYNYEWFKQRHEDIGATRAKVVNAEDALASFKEDAGPRSEWMFEDKDESARLRSVALGLANHLESSIAEYNARASMVNRRIFKHGVPDRIETGGE